MKVEVLQAKDVKFRSKFYWWSTWIDICIFEHNVNVHLLQMRISRTNAKSFRCRSMVSPIKNIRLNDVGDLTQMEANK